MATDDPPDDEPLFDPRITNYNWLAGLLGGVATFLAGYLTMAAVILIPDGPGENASTGDVLTRIGRVLYNAHNVTLDVETIKENVIILDADKGLINGSALRPNETLILNTEMGQIPQVRGNVSGRIEAINVDRLREPIQYAQDKPELLYYLIPVVVLLAAGAVIAYFTLADTGSLHEAVMPGLALATGYTTTAVLGTFFVGTELMDGMLFLTPNLIQTVVFALAYSLACGLAGSYAIGVWRERDGLRGKSSQ